MLFETACAEYMAAKRERLRATTIEGYESAVRRHLMPRWAGVELESIEPEQIQEWVDGFAMPGAAEKAYKTLRQVIRWSIRKLRVRMWDPTTAEIELPRKRPYRPDVLTPKEERRLLRGIYGAPWEAVVLCAAALGLRRCEACALEWGDVDYRTGEVRVSKGVHTVRGGEVTTPTKTPKGDRVLVLPRFALARLSFRNAVGIVPAVRSVRGLHDVEGGRSGFAGRIGLHRLPGRRSSFFSLARTTQASSTTSCGRRPSARGCPRPTRGRSWRRSGLPYPGLPLEIHITDSFARSQILTLRSISTSIQTSEIRFI